jgi:transposase
MLGDITIATELYVVTGYTDMRKSIDGLCTIIRDQLHMEPGHSSALYLFCGKRCDRIKALLHENLSAGFCYPNIFRGWLIRTDDFKRIH